MTREAVARLTQMVSDPRQRPALPLHRLAARRPVGRPACGARIFERCSPVLGPFMRWSVGIATSILFQPHCIDSLSAIYH
jgi:hypothetical protein